MASHGDRSYYNRGGRNTSRNLELEIYMSEMMTRFNKDYERRRRQDNTIISEEEQNILVVEKVEFYSLDNAKAHHTDQFELVRGKPSTPIFRRGQFFYMAIKLSRNFDKEKDIIRLIFNFGPKPSVTKGTKVILQTSLNEKVELNKWDARVHGVTGDTVALQVSISIFSQVGLWKLAIQTSAVNTAALKIFKCKEDIYILFNPWNKDDGVYMENEEEINEYVLNDTGKVWMGSYLQPKGRRWFFGQFDDSVLPAAMHLLEKSGLKHTERGNPVLMARAISAIINSEDENGLIEGKWEGDFADGVSPFAWTGSVAIMEKYIKGNGRSVKYGQCWVFSGASVSICRALGIPARPVTTYVSAHDTNNSLTLEKYFKRDGTEIEGGPEGDCYDSCWNFHVWVDVWMKRPDLSPEFNGWQIIDSTPQELSENAYKCGPTSVEAVRRGEVGLLYDTPFAFAAVNADIFHFQEDEESSWGFSRLNFDDCHVGKKMVTKKIGVDDDDENSNNDMEDITRQYKNPEGSDEERIAVFNAIQGFGKTRLQYGLPSPQQEDVKFNLKEIDTLSFGAPFKIVVHIENLSNETRTIQAIMAANSVFYTGITAYVLKKATGKLVLKPKQKEIMHIAVSPDAYLDKLVDHSMIKIYAIARVKETKQSWSKSDDFQLQKPSIQISVSDDPKVGLECSASFTFTNPINRLLTESIISTEGPGLQRPKIEKFRDVEPHEVVTFSKTFIPKKSGPRKIMATFNSKILNGISGTVTINVKER